MKKILILCYDFPPYISVGGLRPFAWYQYFKEYGIEPVVITRQWSNTYKNNLDYIAPGESNIDIIEKTEYGTIIKSPYKPNLANKLMLKYGENKFKFIRKIISAFFEILQWFFIFGSKSNIYQTANNYLKNNKVDVIIATGDPFILFKYASKLSTKYNIPWIADYRDLWSQDISMQRNLILKKINLYFEKKIIFKASSIVTVSAFFKNNIEKNIKNKNIVIIPNGYNTDTIEKVKNIQQQNTSLNISLIGTIYKWHPIRAFLFVLSNYLIEKPNSKIKLNFYGINCGIELKNMIANEFVNLQNIVEILPKMPNNQLLPLLSKDNVMLLFNDYSIIGTKIYDYIGIKRKIILCFSNDKEANKIKQIHFTFKKNSNFSNKQQEELIKEIDAGIVVENTEHLTKIIDHLYNEFNEKGYIQCNTKNTENYSRRYQTKKLSEVILNLIYKSKL